MRKAIIEDTTGLVVNVVMQKDGDEYSPPTGHSLIDAGNCGPGDTWNGVEFIKPTPVFDKNKLLDAIKNEAERRIDAGTLINGVQFKCNDRSISRIHGMLTAAKEAEAASLPFSQTFMTETGVAVTVNGAADASAIFLVASAFMGAALSASAALQSQVSSMTAAELVDFDAADPVHWP